MATRASPVDDDDDPDLPVTVNPTSVTDRFWVCCRHPIRDLLDESYGKWLVFKPKASGELDEIWHIIRHCVEAKEFGDGCTGAKCSTSLEEPGIAPPGSPNGVVCVYTTKEAIDEVGLQLIQKVKMTIRYKTDEATLSGKYAFKGHGKVTIRTIYWNEGEPIIGPRTLPSDVNPTTVTDDYWVHCKSPPNAANNDKPSGKWLVFEPMESLDETWHMIRNDVEAGQIGRVGCTSAKCSTAFKPEHISPDSRNGVIEVFTTNEGKNKVGMILVHKVQHDILYKAFKSSGHQMATRYSRRNRQKTWLHWNTGEPSFDKV